MGTLGHRRAGVERGRRHRLRREAAHALGTKEGAIVGKDLGWEGKERRWGAGLGLD